MLCGDCLEVGLWKRQAWDRSNSSIVTDGEIWGWQTGAEHQLWETEYGDTRGTHFVGGANGANSRVGI